MSISLRFLVFLFSAVVCVADIPSISVTMETVGGREGEWVVFEGIVSDVGQSKGAVFLNFGGKYPDHKFTVFVPPFIAQMSKAESWKLYNGKRVQVGGIVKLHDGKPEIALKQANFLRIMW